MYICVNVLILLSMFVYQFIFYGISMTCLWVYHDVSFPRQTVPIQRTRVVISDVYIWYIGDNLIYLVIIPILVSISLPSCLLPFVMICCVWGLFIVWCIYYTIYCMGIWHHPPSIIWSSLLSPPTPCEWSYIMSVIAPHVDYLVVLCWYIHQYPPISISLPILSIGCTHHSSPLSFPSLGWSIMSQYVHIYGITWCDMHQYPLCYAISSILHGICNGCRYSTIKMHSLCSHIHVPWCPFHSSVHPHPLPLHHSSPQDKNTPPQMVEATGWNEIADDWWYNNDIYEYNMIYTCINTNDTHHDTQQTHIDTEMQWHKCFKLQGTMKMRDSGGMIMVYMNTTRYICLIIQKIHI